jgi:hypothetical protein
MLGKHEKRGHAAYGIKKNKPFHELPSKIHGPACLLFLVECMPQNQDTPRRGQRLI